MSLPSNPVAAVIHPNPYPYYAQLVERSPFERDSGLGLWVAASAEAVRATLESDACRVRPLDEPVPKALLGSPAAEIFRHLVRMNDGAGHCPFKQAVSASLGSIDRLRLAQESERWAAQLAETSGSANAFMFDLSAHVVGSLIGLPADRLTDVAAWMADFVRCLSPISGPQQIEAGKIAAGRLLELFRSRLGRGEQGTLLAALEREASAVGRADADVIAANAIGFLSQAYEATAGLIGNTLLVLGGRPELGTRADALAATVAEVVRWDAPVQNTRRFVASDATIAGREVRRGEAILVVLAAANRDPRTNRDPARFDPDRPDRRSFTFGAGVHACPGETIAATIARAGIAALLMRGRMQAGSGAAPHYRPSANTRIPVFDQAGWEER
jgi:cytochrome P450